VFANPNRCHALSFLFYKLNKCQTIRWELVGIERSVLDPAAPTTVELNDPAPFDGVTVIPSSVLATSKQWLDVERSARTSVTEKVTAFGAGLFSRAAVLASFASGAEPITAADRQAVLDAVDKELIAEGLLGKNGEVTEATKKLLGWEREIALPTAGVIVKGCLDECDICEPHLDREIELDLAPKHLENELLKKKIELLEKSQEYRCCPDNDEEEITASP